MNFALDDLLKIDVVRLALTFGRPVRTPDELRSAVDAFCLLSAPDTKTTAVECGMVLYNMLKEAHRGMHHIVARVSAL